MSEITPIKSLIDAPAIKLIDWGRSIDMFYNPEREFIGRAGTKCFDCIEMIVILFFNKIKLNFYSQIVHGITKLIFLVLLRQFMCSFSTII